MSGEVYNMASECHLRPAVKAVLQTLAWYADTNGKNIYPAVNTIARRTSLKRRTVQKVLRELEAQLIICAVGSRLGGRRHSTHYEINIKKLQELQKTANAAHPSWRNKSERDSQERVNATPTKGARRSPENQEHETGKQVATRLGRVINFPKGQANDKTARPIAEDRIPDGLEKERGRQIWSVIKQHLKARVDQHRFEIWISPLDAAGCADGVLWIRLPNPEFKEMVERFASDMVASLTANQICDVLTVRFAC